MQFSLLAKFGLDATGVKTEIKQLRAETRSFVNQWGKLALAAGAGAFIALSKSAIDLGSKISDLGEQLRIGTTELQTLMAVSLKAGVSQQDLERSIRNVNLRTQQAIDGNTTYSKALVRLGFNVQDFARLESDKKLEAIAQAYHKAGKSQQAYADVAQILGEKAGPKMLEVLRKLNDDGFPELIRQSKEAGMVLGETTIAALDEAADAIEKFKRRMTVAVGEIIVNFRTEEGIKLMEMQFLRAVGTFATRILDVPFVLGQALQATLTGVFMGGVKHFRNLMLDAAIAVGRVLNKILPERLEINIGNLEKLKDAGVSVGGEIARFISQVKPTALTDAIFSGWDDAIARQKEVVTALNKVDFPALKDTLATGAAGIKTALTEGAKTLPPAGEKAAEPIKAAADALPPAGEEVAASIVEAGSIAARDMMKAFSSITRVGKGYADQTDANLKGTAGRLRSRLSDVGASGMMIGAADMRFNYAEWLTATVIRSELGAIERELAERTRVRTLVTRAGEEAARAEFGDTATDRALRDMKDSSSRTALAVEKLDRKLRNLNARFGIPID